MAKGRHDARALSRRGAGDAGPAGGPVNMIFDNMPGALAQLCAGKVRSLGGRRRSARPSCRRAGDRRDLAGASTSTHGPRSPARPSCRLMSSRGCPELSKKALESDDLKAKFLDLARRRSGARPPIRWPIAFGGSAARADYQASGAARRLTFFPPPARVAWEVPPPSAARTPPHARRNARRGEEMTTETEAMKSLTTAKPSSRC